MSKCYAVIYALLLILLIAVPASAQLILVSTTPADGTTNVTSPATFVLTFSAALDTSVRFAEPGDFFLGLEAWATEELGEPESIEVSPDLKTVTIHGISLPNDSKITILLTGAKSQNGDYLTMPYVITLSTAATLPDFPHISSERA